MNKLIAVAAVASLALGGCCSKVQSERYDTVTSHEAWTDLQYCGIFSGYGAVDYPERAQAVYTPVTASELGDLLCESVDLEYRASCINRVNDYVRNIEPKGGTTSGPFVMTLDKGVYFGDYQSTPFTASFQASGDGGSCSGRYSAVEGEKKPVFDVTCDGGRRGKADIVLARDGRNGIGYVQLDDGTQGQIIFGKTAVGAAEIKELAHTASGG